MKPLVRKISVIATVTVLFTIKIVAQVNPNKDRLVVLRHNKIGKSISFDRSTEKGHDSTVIIYLGKLKTKSGRVFKILVSRWYWGINLRATSRIVVFNKRNQYLGNYYVTTTLDLPVRIENNMLVFDNKKNGDCDQSIVTYISFRSGIPKRFFVKCKNNLGDIWSFQSEE